MQSIFFPSRLCTNTQFRSACYSSFPTRRQFILTSPMSISTTTKLTFNKVYDYIITALTNKNIMSRRPELNLSNLSEFTRQISGTEAYRDERSKERPETDGDHLPTAVKLGALALSETKRTETGRMSPEGYVFRLISTIDDFVAGQKKLEYLRDRNAPFVEREPYLDKVIAFNHAAKELVDQEPKLRFDELRKTIVHMYTASNRYTLPDDPYERHVELSRVTGYVEGALNGMRHELAYEQILGELFPLGVDYEATTLSDEKEGVDYFILMDNSRFGVDVKASSTGLIRSQEKSLTPERIVFSHVENKDFNGGFRISQELAKQKAPEVYRDLQKAYRAAA